jgi:hypothetical protein
VDDIIEPAQTRFRLIRALEMLANKKDSIPPRKHGNMPLIKVMIMNKTYGFCMLLFMLPFCSWGSKLKLTIPQL